MMITNITITIGRNFGSKGREIGEKLNIPPYVIFMDKSLDEMATFYPINIKQLVKINGVGEGKALRYGREFCALIAKYCEENDIDGMDDEDLYKSANKTNRRKNIVRYVDRRVALPDIAKAEGMEYDELLAEIYSIVQNGTKLNVDYYIDEILDEDAVQDIYRYFREDSMTDSLDEAIDELGEDYSEEEIELVRIKFVSEMGN